MSLATPQITSILIFHSTPHPPQPAVIMETQNNHFFYAGHRQPSSPAASFNLNIHNHHHHELQQDFTNKEHMFEKPLTPSDVGKLNRLVIPKQHAEKYFPLLGGADQQKGLLLTFEDDSGKLWRFRYSYWTSSQSYVLTKGWSRYVKDKSLDAGDIVLFERLILDCDRMFICCRRRRSAVVPVQDRMVAEAAAVAQPAQVSEWSTRVLYDAQFNYPSPPNLPLSLPLPYQHDYLHAGEYENVEDINIYKREVVARRQLRLFGVNLECPDDSEPSASYGSSLQLQGGQLQSNHQ